jgi:oligopeptide/dipeptide ABC transporter ATP-binding protein
MSASTAPSTILSVRNIETQFSTRRGTVFAVNRVSFDVTDGEIVGLVGESGSGKSVTVRSVLRLIRPPGRIIGGSAEFEGADLHALSESRLRQIRGSGIGFVSQNPFGSLNPILPIERQFHNVIRAHRRTTRGESRRVALEALQSVGIAGPDRVLGGYAHELSGGMAQRVVIGIALVLRPRLLIADEPTTALDVTVQRQILDLIRDLARERRMAVLLVTHDLGVVAQYCQRVIVMYAGKVVEEGPVQHVFKRPAHPYTRALLDAVPRAGKPLAGVSAGPPRAVDYPTGCPYRERCTFAFARCATEAPALRVVGHQRSVSCHLDLEPSNVAD